MKILFDIFRILAVALASAALFMSCLQEQVTPDAVGYLATPALDVDLTVEDMMATKASVDLPLIPDISEITFVVTGSDGRSQTFTGPWTSNLVMPVGTYTVKASYGSNSFGHPWLSGETSGTIEALDQEVPSVHLSLKNALVKVSVGADLAEHFTLSSVTFNDSETVAASGNILDWYYVPAGFPVNVVCSGASSAGVAKDYTQTINPGAKTALNIVLKQDGNNLPSITISDAQGWGGRMFLAPASFTNISSANQDKVRFEVSASGNWNDTKTSVPIKDGYHVVKDLPNGSAYSVRACVGNLKSNVLTGIAVEDNMSSTTFAMSHTYDGNVLTGSKADLNYGISGIVATLQSKGYLMIEGFLAKGSTAGVRIFAPKAGTTSATMTDGTSNWPYLPKGSDYKLTVKHWLIDDTGDVETSERTGIAMTEDPVFEVTLNKSYCSYDDYMGKNDRSRNPTLANSLAGGRTAESIYDVGASWTIHENVMNKTQYAKEVVVLRDGTETSLKDTAPTASSYNPGTLTGNTWAQHKVTTKVTFDGVSVTPEARVHEITGLPYSYDFHENNNAIPSNWTAVGIKTENKKLIICYDGSDGYMVSPKFNYNGLANYIVEAQYYTAGAGKSIDMYVGISNTTSHTGLYDIHTINYNATTGENHAPFTGALNVSSTNPYVYIYHNKYDYRLNLGLFTTPIIDYLAIYEFHLKYSE